MFPVILPVARTVPFDPTDPAAIIAGISSTDVQAAIIEAKNDAINNDRYPVIASFNGNAIVGRFLEIFPGQASDDSPFIAPDDSLVVAYSFAAAASTSGTIRIYNLTQASTILDIVFTAQSVKTQTGLLVGGINAGDALQTFVQSGSFNKPRGFVWYQTNT